MSFDRDALAACISAHGPVIRVVIAEVAGSSPRDVGAAMIVWAGGQQGTIGGGALEYEAAAQARTMLADGTARRFTRHALGPSLGQCCGGSVALLAERWDAAALAEVTDPIARPVTGPGRAPTGPNTGPNARPVQGDGPPPFALRRLIAQGRQQRIAPRLVQGWLVEPLSRPTRQLWIWGAGHVGRALVGVLHPLPDFALHWADTDAARFPDLPPGVTQMIAENLADLVPLAPQGAEHLILTFSHVMDLELCHRLLGHGFGWAGLIGSATKWARFRSRLAALGHSDASISRICCPIGDPTLGKHPQAIAVGVAAALLSPARANQSAKDRAG